MGELAEWQLNGAAKCPPALRQAGAPVAAGECEFFADGCEDWGPLAAHAAHHAGLAAALAWPYWRGLVARGERHGAFRRLGKG